MDSCPPNKTLQPTNHRNVIGPAIAGNMTKKNQRMALQERQRFLLEFAQEFKLSCEVLGRQRYACRT